MVIPEYETIQNQEDIYSDGEEPRGPEYCNFNNYDEDQDDADIGGMFSDEDSEENLQNSTVEENIASDEPTVQPDRGLGAESNSAFGSGEGSNIEVDVDGPGEPENLTQEQIQLYLDDENVAAAERASQEALSNLVPTMNMVFDTHDQVYAFYNEYTSIHGFSMKKASVYNTRIGDKTVSTRRTYRCNKSDPVLPKEVIEERRRKKQQRKRERTCTATPNTSKERNTNRIEITGCEAKKVITLKHEKWIVTSLDLQHNHELCRHDETKFMRSHKHMTDQEKLYIRTFNSVNLPTRHIMAILTYLRGGKLRDVPYDKKCVSNERTKFRNEDNSSDMMQVLKYFRKRKAEDPEFFYDFEIVDGNKVKSIFWADGFQRKMYDLYGDCLSFDTTYKTNKYNLPFAPFVGVTGHGQNCIFACAIIGNETKLGFDWLFQIFLKCMGGKHPLTIITDQDVAMSKSIPDCFPNSIHRNCFFHIKKKCQEKCGRCFGTIPYLHADFCDILHNSLTVSEFEFLWQEMIVKYNVGHIKYFQDMWKYRLKFLPVYFKTAFLPFIHSTARSEGTNAIFKDNVGSTSSVISFMTQYERISENIEESEKHQDLVTRNTEPKYWQHTELEYQAGAKYNIMIFYKFQKQMKFSTKLHVDEIQKNERYEVYKSNMLAMRDFRRRRYVVLVNVVTQDLTCICGKFQKDGTLCGHVLRVLVHLNISELPDKYYLERWMPKNRKEITNIQFNVPRQLTQDNMNLRYNVLSRRLNEIASTGAKSDDRYLMVLADAEMIADKLDKMAEDDELRELQEKRKENVPVTAIDDGYGYLRDPDVAPSKGRPTGPGRQKTFMEELFSKQTITCSHCGEHNHNIATCTNLHIPRSEFQKKKRAKRKAPTSASNAKQQAPGRKQTANKSKATNEKEQAPGKK